MSLKNQSTQMKYDKEDVSQNNNEERIELSEAQHDALMTYLTHRLDAGQRRRMSRLDRYGRIDQMMSTWQRLSAEDSKRDMREDATGKSQAIPMNLPVAQAHVDDATSFYSEIFAPIGGNYYANPGKRTKTPAVQALTKKMDQDSKINRYYMHVANAMRALNKYNFGGFHVSWTDGNRWDESAGNICESVDVYNLLYDNEIQEVHDLYKEGEWAAIARVRNRMWFIRQHRMRGLMNLDKVIGEDINDRSGSNSSIPGQAKYYRDPPRSGRVSSDGADERTANDSTTSDMDWAAFGLGLAEDSTIDIAGHEVVLMYCWINESQFELDDDSEENSDPLQLYAFSIADGKYIVDCVKMTDAIEIPIYMARLNQDDLKEAARSIAEHLRPFQRLMSFQVNTYVEGIRSQLWGLKGIDPQMFDVKSIQNGETAGLLVSKQPGRDVRTGFMNLTTSLDSRQNMEDSALTINMMKLFFPSQSAPSQIAGMDRAVNSQVSAVLQGSMRKIHMLVRLLDASLMQPVRMAQYRNIANFDPQKSDFKDVTAEEVAELLSSGLGQLTREAAAEQIRTLIFALIQNPDGAQGIDMQGLWTLYSALLNIGTDLGEFMMQQTLTTENSPGAGPDGQPIQQAPPEGAAQPMPGGI